MNWKSYFLGVLSGAALMFVILFVAGLAMRNSGNSDPVQYLDRPVSYENKPVAAFKIFQVLNGAALAEEVSVDESFMLDSKMVLILGDSFYDEQVVRIQNPQRIGTYSYTTQSGMSKTVPVIGGQ